MAERQWPTRSFRVGFTGIPVRDGATGMPVLDGVTGMPVHAVLGGEAGAPGEGGAPPLSFRSLVNAGIFINHAPVSNVCWVRFSAKLVCECDFGDVRMCDDFDGGVVRVFCVFKKIGLSNRLVLSWVFFIWCG